MSEQTINGRAAQGGDVGLAAAALLCLGLGAAGVWYFTSGGGAGGGAAALPERLAPVRGEAFLAPASKRAQISEPAPAAAAAKTPEPQAPAASKPPATDEKGYEHVDFDVLGGFIYEPPDPLEASAVERPDALLETPKNFIPDTVTKYKGKRVAVQGFMMPIKYENEQVTVFLLTKARGYCCGFGQAPRMNEWIFVKMGDAHGADFVHNQLVTVYGTLDVGEEKRDGVVMSIYRLACDSVAGPLDL